MIKLNENLYRKFFVKEHHRNCIKILSHKSLLHTLYLILSCTTIYHISLLILLIVILWKVAAKSELAHRQNQIA